MRTRPSLIVAIAREALALPDGVAHALVLRDLDAWLRVQFLGVAARTGIADALTEGPTINELATRAGVVDVDLLATFLRVGIALGEIRERHGRFAVKGRRLRAVVGGSRDLRGLVEELVAYDSPVYLHLAEHLRGGPKGDYLDGLGDVIANASRLAEPLLAPVIRATVRAVAPRSVLDVGCGTGVYLAHVLEAAPHAAVVGIDVDPDVIAAAQNTTSAAVTRPDVRCADLFDLPEDLRGPFDLVLLLQNIYYWPPEKRPAVLGRLRELAPAGTVVVATAVPTGPAFNHHLDLAFRVTERTWRLPTAPELVNGLRAVGFTDVDALGPVPRSGLFVAVAT